MITNAGILALSLSARPRAIRRHRFDAFFSLRLSFLFPQNFFVKYIFYIRYVFNISQYNIQTKCSKNKDDCGLFRKTMEMFFVCFSGSTVEVGSGKRDGTLYWLVSVLFFCLFGRGNDPSVCAFDSIKADSHMLNL